MFTNLHQHMAEAPQADLPRPTRNAQHASNPAPKENAMTNNLRLKLVALLTTIAMLALPIAQASAHAAWG